MFHNFFASLFDFNKNGKMDASEWALLALSDKINAKHIHESDAFDEDDIDDIFDESMLDEDDDEDDF